MTQVDSAIRTIEEAATFLVTSQGSRMDLDESPYVDNHSRQPSAVYYIFPHSGAVELYASWPLTAYSPGATGELADEFLAWDILSDEALASFEQELE